MSKPNAKPKHTAGTWEAGGVEWVESPEGGHRWEQVLAQQGWTIALVQADEDDPEMMANRPRILDCVNACQGLSDPSVVPDLLAALRALVGAQDAIDAGTVADCLGRDAAIDAARAAIARAEGVTR